MKKLLSIVLTLAMLLSVIPMAIGASAAEANDPAYKFVYDAGEQFRTSYDSSRANTGTIKFDYYLKSGSVKVYGSDNGEQKGYLEEGEGSFELSVDSKSFWIDARNSAAAELYIWNVELTQGGSALDFASYTSRTTCDFSTITYGEIPFPNVEDEEPEFVGSGDYAIYVDNSASEIQTNKIWFNLLGMSGISLESGKEYTLKFDNYALNASTAGHCYQGINGTGGDATDQKWWNTADTLNGWAEQSKDFTVRDGQTLVYHGLHVGGGFKGYLDNFRVYEGNTLVAKFEFDATCNGKESSGATVVALPLSVLCDHVYDNDKDAECNECGFIREVDLNNYVVEVDASEVTTDFGQLYVHEVGMPHDNIYPAGEYTFKFDFYATQILGNKNFVAYLTCPGWNGDAFPNGGQKWLELQRKIGEWQTVSFDVTTIADGQFPWFYIGKGIKGYFDNFQIINKTTGEVLMNYEFAAADLNKTSKVICTVVAMPENPVIPPCPHAYDNACDTNCNYCNEARTVGEHVYDNACDATCNECNAERTVGEHVYDNACDATCNVCDEPRETEHNFEWVTDKKNNCGVNGAKHEECTVCHEKRNENTVIAATGKHTYSNNCDTKCNVCSKTRTITHTYKTTTTKATTSKNGKIVKACSVCKKVYSTKTIYYAKKVKLSTTEYTYNGKAKKPSVKVYDYKGNKISSSYYTVSYASGRKKVGKYKVTIKLKGNYSGTLTAYFTINPKETKVSSISAAKKSLKVKISKVSSQASGYEIQYSTSSKFKSAKTKKVTSYKTTSVTFKSLKAKKTYYVRVRTYKVVDGRKYYSDWSSKKSKKTK